ncbi:hypothetical protein GCM10027056_30710 [Glaciibacter psychrotolerans]
MRSQTAKSSITVGFNTGDLPANGAGDGVTNSFKNRLSDAVLAWNGPILSSGGQPHGMTYVGETYPGNTAQVLVMVRSLDAGQLGLTIISPSSCEAVHGTKVNMGIPVVVHLATRNDWFTQDNSRRSLWEGCPGSGYSPTYTCSKTQDVGSTITHELGHVLGLAHPRQTDQHVNGTAPSTVMSLAKCAVANDQATMCQAGDAAGSGIYRTHRRTLDNWDLNSLSHAS